MESTEEDQPEVFQLARIIHDRSCGNRQLHAVIERLVHLRWARDPLAEATTSICEVRHDSSLVSRE